MVHRSISLGLLIVLAFSPSILAQNVGPHNKSQVEPDSRFEIVQSSLAARNTFRIDRFSGLVWVLVSKANGDWTWELVERLSHPYNKVDNINKVNFQLFTSGMAVKFTFLMNVNTGATWVLSEDSKTKELFFSPMT